MLLSIVTITKDDATGLARTLASTAELRTKGAEQIVVDGSITPDQRSLVDGLCQDRSILLVHRPPAGISDAFNEGLRLSQGRWVWFLNGGDAVHETLDASWFLSLLDASRGDIITGTIHFDGEGAPRRLPPMNYLWPMVACWMAHPATLVTRQWLTEHGGFNRRWSIAMDYDLWIRLMKRQCVVDMLSLPFARFDVTGVSEGAGTRSRAEVESARVITHHAFGLFRDSVWSFLRVQKRILQAWMRSVFSR